MTPLRTCSSTSNDCAVAHARRIRLFKVMQQRPSEVARAGAFSPARAPQRVTKDGWYSADVRERSSPQRLIELEFVPDGVGQNMRFTLRDSGAGGKQAAWIHVSEPGIISKLPGVVRGLVRHEVDLTLGFAKWVGVGCYLIWTVKDIFAGIGLLLAA